MIGCCEFVASLERHGWIGAAGVPCATFAGPIAHLHAARRYEASANEGTALASAVGAALGGRRRAVFLQNSGLGNVVNPLASLVAPYGVPVLAVMSMRGWPDPAADEPQHQLMGRATIGLLDQLGLWHTILDDDRFQLDAALDRAQRAMARGVPAFILVPPGLVGRHPHVEPSSDSSALPGSGEVAQALSDWVCPDDLIVSTTGYLSRYLFASGDRPRNFYMQGSMGHAAAIGLGYATARPGENVIVLDGDGALIMHLGVLSTIGAAAPVRLTHVVVDNGCYASTGGQVTSARHTDLAAVARACGYRTAVTVAGVAELRAALEHTREVAGPHLVMVSANPAVDGPPPRASAAVELSDVAARLANSSVAGAA